MTIQGPPGSRRKFRLFRGGLFAVLLGLVLAACAGGGIRGRESPAAGEGLSSYVPPEEAGAGTTGGPAGTGAGDPAAEAWWEAGDIPGEPADLAPGLRFVPGALSLPALPPGVGILSRESRDQAGALEAGEGAEVFRRDLAESFRRAYIGGLLRGFPLEGALGGDEVHLWPGAGPGVWVQNWRSAEAFPNSWGLPSLVLAIRGAGNSRVFILRGAVLDLYGRAGGAGGANGAAGYGAPRGNEFPCRGGVAQRFDRGLFVIDREGRGVFLPGEAPSSAEEAPPDTGLYPGAGLDREGLQNAFRSAWYEAVDREPGPLVPDAPVEYAAPPPRAWRIPLEMAASGADGAPEALEITGLYLQSFNRGAAVLVLADVPGLPLEVRLLGGPFLEALRADGGLLRGLARYGIPLTDAIPWEGGAAQRFSRGWMLAGEEPED